MEEEFEDMIMDMEETSAIDDVKEEEYSDPKAGQIVSFVKEKYSKAETSRRMDEERWVQAYRNYRGLYGPDVQFTSTEKSKIFVKVTKTKVLAAYGQIAEVLFGGNKFPITIDPTVLPDNVEETVNFETNPQAQKAQEEMGELLPGETYQDFKERLSSLKAPLEPVIDKLQAGPAKTPTSPQFHPADVAAKKMEKKIHDQLEESHAKTFILIQMLLQWKKLSILLNVIRCHVHSYVA
mgnify:CR=1 FL=1